MSNFILIFFWGGGGGGVKGKGGGHPHPYDSLYELFWIPSLSSEEWKKLKASDREKLGIVFENDGEFWWVQLYANWEGRYSKTVTFWA